MQEGIPYQDYENAARWRDYRHNIGLKMPTTIETSIMSE